MMGCCIKNRCAQKGYTLIELLLVVTVLSFIAALGVKTYRDKAVSDRINIAALNIQHVLEAGIAYNIANGMWPKKNWSNSTCTNSPDDTLFVQNFLPNNTNQSNFGVPMCWSGEDPKEGDQKAQRFWVALNVGNPGDETVIATAQRLAARLPNAIITNDPGTDSTANTCSGNSCFVKAMVTVPSGGGAGGPTAVAAVGNCDSNLAFDELQPGSGQDASCKRTSLYQQFGGGTATPLAGITDADKNLPSLSQYEISFKCKPGETPNVYVVPNFVRMDRYKGGSAAPPQPNTLVDPMYELSGAPELNSKVPNNYYVDYHNYCADGVQSDGSVKCRVTMVATYGFQNGSELVTVGCTTHMQSLHICTCVPDKTEKGVIGGGCMDENSPQYPGAVGASYIAMCNRASVPPAGLADQKPNKNYW